MTTQCVVRAALTEERSKAEISLGFAVSRRDQVLLPSNADTNERSCASRKRTRLRRNLSQKQLKSSRICGIMKIQNGGVSYG
jgi:hypothetical protein